MRTLYDDCPYIKMEVGLSFFSNACELANTYRPCTTSS